MPATPGPIRISRRGGLAQADIRALGTTVIVVTAAAGRIARAATEVGAELAAIESACGRNRPDSELEVANRAHGHPVAVGPLLAEALEVALRAAGTTAGAMDPTGGAGWPALRFNRLWGTLQMPAGVSLDLSAIAGPLAADRAAARASVAVGAGVLVGVGAHVATAGGAPAGGWSVQVAGQRALLDGPGGMSALRPTAPWCCVSVTAGSCVDAAIAAAGACVRGDAAAAWLESVGVAARLGRPDGSAVLVGRWPVGRLAA